MPTDNDVSEFIEHLYSIVNDPQSHSAVEWSRAGDEIIVRSEDVFTTEILQRYFRASTFASFVRQLNLYGFSKRGNRFYHPHFHRDQPDQLVHVKRKNQLATAQTKKKSKVVKRKSQVQERHSARLQENQVPDYALDASSEDDYGHDDDENEYHNDDTYYYDSYPNTTTTATTNSLFPFEEPTHQDIPYQQNYIPQQQQQQQQQQQLQQFVQIPLNDNEPLITTQPPQLFQDYHNLAQPQQQTNPNSLLPLPQTTNTMDNNNSNNSILPPLLPATFPPTNAIVPLEFPPTQRTTHTITPSSNGPQSVPIDQYNAIVSGLEDQVDLLTQQYQLLYQSQYHILQLLSRYFGRDLSGFTKNGGISGVDLMTLDPAIVELAALDGNNNSTTDLKISNFDHDNNNKNQFQSATIIPQPARVHISVETPTTPNIQVSNSSPHVNNNSQQTPILLPNDDPTPLTPQINPNNNPFQMNDNNQTPMKQSYVRPLTPS